MGTYLTWVATPADPTRLRVSSPGASSAVLVGSAASDARAGWFGTDWRFEWIQEVGLLYLRLRDAPDGEVKALLRDLLAETPRTLDEWLILAGMIRDAELDLRRVGNLLPIPNFGP